MLPSRDDYLSTLLIQGPPAARCQLVRSLPSDDFGPRVLARLRSDDQPLLVRGIAIADAAWIRASRRLQALATVQDEHASTLMAYGRHEGLAYFVHAFEEGPRLTAVLRRRGGRLRLPTLLPLFAQVLLAVSDAHRHGVVVGGVRPQELRLVEADGTAVRVRMRDFGMAAVLGVPAGRTGATDHPSIYRAPEPDVSTHPASDVFSLGVLFVRLLTGPLPVQGDDAERVQLLHERLALARTEHGLPDEVATLIESAIALDLQARPASAVQLLDALLERVPAASLRLSTDPPVEEPWVMPPAGDQPHWPARQWTVPDPPRARGAKVDDAELDPLLDSAVDLRPDGSKPPIITGHTVVVPPVAAGNGRRTRAVMLGVGLAAAAGLAALVVGGPKPAPEAASGPVVTAVATATVATIEPGTLIVETSPVGALTIDGVAIGTTPHRGALKPGRHVVRIQAEGHRAWRSRIDLQPGEARRLEVTLEPEPSRPRVASPPAITVGHR